MMDDYSLDPKWYVAHTYSGYENKVKDNIEKIVENRNLSDVITDVRIPVETVVEMDGDQKKESEAKMFPSYVLVKMVMNDATWHVIRNITGVTGFVGPGSKPVALTDAEVAALGIDLANGEETSARKTTTLGFAVGDTVAIREDVLFGVNTATVTAISPDLKKVNVTALMFGRETPIELDAADVKPLK